MTATSNPLARQRRLGVDLFTLRTTAGLSHAALARLSGVSASVISRLENPTGDIGRRPNLLMVRRLLDALEVPRGSDRFTRVEGYAEVAAARHWWDRLPRMGTGQRDYAIVECGAAGIDEYAGLLIPGLVQTEAYAHHRVLTATADGPQVDVEAVVTGRLARQQATLPGAAYRLVLEEQAIRRPPAPRPVMAAQLRHLLDLIAAGTVSVRVVPVDADLGDGYAPRAPYASVTYPDPDDPAIVIVDSDVARPALVTADDAVKGYQRLHERLLGAALSDADSAALIERVASSLAAR